jgi:GAF domain-containing protein
MDVPIRVRGEVIGTLHLQDSDHGGFTADDRELAQALASTAGMAVQNARLCESARRRGEWLQASAAITRELLSEAEGDVRPLDLIARSIRDVAHADVVAVLRPDREPPGTTQLCAEVVVGPEGIAETGGAVPLEGSVFGQVFTEGRSICLTPGDIGEWVAALPWAGLDTGAVLVAPLAGSGTARGVLCAARLRDRPGFSATDQEMAGGFANQAAVAIELVDARAEQQRAVVFDERERIAADLQDTVVQRLFAVGLALQGVLADLGQSRAADRIRATVDEVDRTINQIRSALFPLQAPGPGFDPRDRVLVAVAETIAALGFEPDLRFAGLLAGTVTADLVEDVVFVVREALLDVGRRGRATSAAVDVVEDRDGLVVHVRDDDPRGDGAAAGRVAGELQRRAARHGGTFTVTAGTPAGTSFYWWVPRT